MTTRTITSANSVFTLTVPDVFPIPIQVQGYAADSAFAVDPVDSAETMMGVDGKMSAGFTPFITPMTIELQADSPSVDLFDTWLQAQETQREIFYANAAIVLPSTGRVYTLLKGALKRVKKIPDAKKVLQPVQYSIDWEAVQVAPVL
jgi:hypothetical protein